MDLPLTVGDVAPKYSLSHFTTRKYARDGRFPGAEKIGGEWRFPTDVRYVAPPKKEKPKAAPALRDRLDILSSWRTAA